VQKTRNFALYWLPVILWMSLIFGFSSDSKSFQHSSRILEPLLRWLLPNLAPNIRDDIVFVARKCAHLTEYAVLALLVWRLLRKPVRRDPRPWNWRVAGLALLVAALYAASDEFHQTFVPTRDGCVRDVFIDSCGAAAGLLLLWLLGKWRKHW
jgi:VanZ family protein